MDIIVISSKDKFRSEIPHVIKLFDAGLERFHLRKPKFTQQRFEEYINNIPERYHNRVVIHSFHELAKKYNLKGVHLTKRHKKYWFKNFWHNLFFKIKKPHLTFSTSCHDLVSLKDYSSKYDYVFFTPVFDSNTKIGRSNVGFPIGSIRKTLKEINSNNIFALGGVDSSKIDEAKLLGFDGVALLGAVWYSDQQPIKVFEEAVAIEMGKKTQKIELNPVSITL